MSFFMRVSILFFLFCATAHASQSPTFPLGSGDVLEISVWGDESLARKVLVRPDGKISFPLVGDMQAAGVSVEDLRTELETRIGEYIHGAPVTVMLIESRSSKVSVVGKVQKPGVFPMDGPMSVLQALAMAGGMTPYASTGSVRVVRTDAAGVQSYLPFDYDHVAGGKSLEQNVLLVPGDIVIVP
ncbi:polysaccharide biosynthesis/export family protein [Desulfomicrobium baculatum]|uniref:Polysaccharide export protein n=1 Tax=Desulfomicrobium baculatum (strain DSM 4028 / VKM B-1378 / X) TaxID=525897 RepID=C7LSB5_DESBD|nr:polysaccharide biosynthesis/export family protein [Desulfomicrobium baculatum]ACU90663.1 polysaccharide export protein [Desulfomicrobium baculatum DSM 4028]